MQGGEDGMLSEGIACGGNRIRGIIEQGGSMRT